MWDLADQIFVESGKSHESFWIKIFFFHDGVTLNRDVSIDRSWPHGSNDQRTQLQAYPVDLVTWKGLQHARSIHVVYNCVHHNK